MIIPYKVDVPLDRTPLVNWGLITLTILAFVLQVNTVHQNRSFEPIEPFVLNGWNPVGIIGYLFLHSGIIHLLGNMLFLWIFGNAVCSKIKNYYYLPIYFILGICAAITHLIFSNGAAIGASGAINGVVGMYLVFFPLNEISCLYIIYFRPGFFSLSSFWMILMWFTFDILGVLLAGQGVAYFAHIGGFLAGVAIAVTLLKLKIVQMEPRYEKSLLEILKLDGKKDHEEKPPRKFEDYLLEKSFVHHQEIQSAENTTPAIKNNNVIKESTDEDFFSESNFTLEPEPLGNTFIRFKCDCGQKVKIHSKFAGQKGKCPKCKTSITIPTS